MRAKRAGDKGGEAQGAATEEEPPGSREARRRWAALIRRVFEVDPLTCPKYEGTMRVVSFIPPGQRPSGRRRAVSIFRQEQILRQCGLWDPPGARDPPGGRDPGPDPASSPSAEPEVELDPEYLEHLWQAGELTETP